MTYDQESAICDRLDSLIERLDKVIEVLERFDIPSKPSTPSLITCPKCGSELPVGMPCKCDLAQTYYGDPYAGEGFRLLASGEIIQEGDEWQSCAAGAWNEPHTVDVGRAVKSDTRWRRKLPPKLRVESETRCD